MKIKEITNYGYKTPAKGTLRWKIAQQKRKEFLDAFAKDPHGKLETGDKIVGPSGVGTFKRTQTDENTIYPIGTKVRVKSGGMWHDGVITDGPHKESGYQEVRFKYKTRSFKTRFAPNEIKPV